MQPTEFQTPAPSALTGEFYPPVIKDTGLAPNTIIHLGDEWHIGLSWMVKGPMAPLMGGKWTIQTMLEVMGPGNDLSLPPKEVLVDDTVPALQRDYTATIDVPGNAVPAAGVYKLVLAIVHHQLNVSTQTACFVEGPLIQFYA